MSRLLIAFKNLSASSVFNTQKKHQLKSQVLKEKLDFALTLQQKATPFSDTTKAEIRS